LPAAEIHGGNSFLSKITIGNGLDLTLWMGWQKDRCGSWILCQVSLKGKMVKIHRKPVIAVKGDESRHCATGNERYPLVFEKS